MAREGAVARQQHGTTLADNQPRTSESTGGTSAEPPTRPRPAALILVLTGSFMTALDVFIVNVAIPSMTGDLRAGPAAIQWVVAGYALAIAAGLITGGRLGDIYGRRRMYAVAMALFTLASVACGLAPTVEVLVTARVVQGLAAALLGPQVLAIINTAYAGRARAGALNAYGVTLGLAAVFGQLIGGLLIEADLMGLGWRNIFLINLPIGLVAVSLIPRVVPELAPTRRARLDLVGAVLVTTALLGTMLPLIQGREQGWPGWTWLCLAASGVLFVAFAWHQRLRGRRHRAPLVDLHLFRSRSFVTGLLAQLAFWLGQASFFLVLALYLQAGRGLSALESGVFFTGLGAGYLAASLLARRLAARLGRQVIALGAALMIAGEFWMLVDVRRSVEIGWLLPPMAVHAAGMGLVIAPLVAIALSGVAPGHAGAASGVLSTAQQIGNGLGVAIIGVFFYSAPPGDHALAFSLALAYLMAVGAAVVGLAQLLPRPAADARRQG
ncbi:MFS transporter [Plantactinospora sp. GCM10030261]|uniref:MFS transporter n=1 Tax=Plantactinospora sp. GCM10030261 TaxID=3273420 RepID=UPI00360B86A9